jgi:hypothetical protein
MQIRRKNYVPPSETVGDALDRGTKVRLVEPSELSPEIQARLLDLCKADSQGVRAG